ncbi:MAG: ABC transporter permease [Bacteroidetes bacterium]|nr:ABC transporter permease [Bacteroidota bacterium]HET6242967.1 FtsX-like permease family protein [Bacteroidia bacterium]
MNFPFFIAKRYLISKKSQNVINIITKIAITGVAVGTMALIVVLSAFNGIENLVVSLFNAFDPDIKITAVEGKTFNRDNNAMKKIKALPGVAFYTEVIEENALLKYKEKQYIAKIKGVGENFVSMSRLDTMLIDGEFLLEKKGTDYAVLGQGVAVQLGINLLSIVNPVQIYVPRRTKEIGLTPDKAFKTGVVYPAGVFSIQHDFDTKYIIVPIKMASELLDYKNRITGVEIGIAKGYKVSQVQKQIQEILGNEFYVKDRFQQHDMLYRIMKSEKWAIYLILTFILIIATFNVIGSITMLIIDKKKDIGILSNMGAGISEIRKIFFIEGILISMIGAVIGLLTGFLLCILQINFELIKLEGTFVMEAYPISMKIEDFVAVFLTVLVIGAFAAWFPARQITRNNQ